jgi:hypothetical protein
LKKSKPNQTQSLPPDAGIVYSATTHDRYVEEAFLSAESVKRLYPRLPITLFTDRPSHLLCGLGLFDNVEKINTPRKLTLPFAKGQLARLWALLRTPYERTLHLDTDTRVLTPELPELFNLLENFDLAMVETTVDDSYSRYHYGRRMYNVGVQLFRKSRETRYWLETWIELTERNFLATTRRRLEDIPSVRHIVSEEVRRKLLNMDQISLVEVLSPEINQLGLKFYPLNPSWNHRGSKLPENNQEPVKILHLPELRQSIPSDLLAVANSWRSAGKTEAESLVRYITSLYPDKKNPGG